MPKSMSDALDSPLGREAVAAALLAGAAAAAAVFAGRHSAKIRSAAAALSDASREMTGTLAEAAADSAGSMISSLTGEGGREERRGASRDVDVD